MNAKHLTRREALLGLAATPLVDATPEAASLSICFMSAVEMARLIRTKKLSAREALAAHMKQIERVNPKVNAIVTLVPELAPTAAAKADEKQARRIVRAAPWAPSRAQRFGGDSRHPNDLRLAAL